MAEQKRDKERGEGTENIEKEVVSKGRCGQVMNYSG